MNAILILVAIAATPSDYYSGSVKLASISDYYSGQPSAPVTQAVIEKPKPKATTAPAHAGYPVRGSHWTFPGSGRQQLIAHLQSGQHAGKFSSAWLNSLSYQELLSLHDDDHEHRVKPVQRATVAAATKEEKREAKEEAKAEKELGRVIYGTRDGKHPGPLGSSIRAFFGDPRYRSYSSCPNGRCPR